MLIMTSHVSQQTNDKRELEPAIANLAALPKALGKVKKVITDNGFYSETNVGACEKNKITPYIAFGRINTTSRLWIGSASRCRCLTVLMRLRG